MDAKFTPEQMSDLKTINDGQHLFNFFACLLLKSHSTEKRVILFLQKHLSRTTFYSHSHEDVFVESSSIIRLVNTEWIL
jgi:hypothetical protein